MHKSINSFRHLGTSNSSKISGLLLFGIFVLGLSSFALAAVDTQNDSHNISDDIGTQVITENKAEEILHNSPDKYNPSDNNEDGNYVGISGESINIDVDNSDDIRQNNSSSNISVEISSKTESTSVQDDIDENQSAPGLIINGQEIEIPKNGRFRETVKDGNSTTKLRTNIDNEGTSSISIDTNIN